MNIVVVMLDSLRQDHVSFYGWPGCPVKTPNLDALAAEAVVFDNMYPEGLPTIPVRTDLFTGQSSLTNRSWQPLVPTDVSGATIFRREKYLTALVADTYHLFKPNMNFHDGFEIFHWIRGQEYDSLRAGPLKRLRLEDHINARIPEHWHRLVLAALRNLDDRVAPEDYPCWKTMQTALNVLDDARAAKRPVFLWVDTFQPHEPWCPPAKFDTFGDPSYSGPKIVLPPGGPAEAWGSEPEFRRICSLYAGEAAYTDYCVGHLLKGMRQMGYFDDTLIVVLSDHGHPLCDHGKFLKGPDRMYSELLKVPFIVRLPGGAKGGRRVSALGRFPDLLPTLLDLAGLGANARCVCGRSLRPVIEGTGASPNVATVSGYFPSVDRAVRDERYSYVMRPAGQTDELYDLQADPRERVNLIAKAPEIARRLQGQVGTVFLSARSKPRGVQGSMEVAHTPAG
ncbi:MAG: sulfatase-like hydrolase/transferase [Planctomycetota bacterium]|nr:sulfatase-like hydrolase/transferase [Planctomycetota bacterium]